MKRKHISATVAVGSAVSRSLPLPAIQSSEVSPGHRRKSTAGAASRKHHKVPQAHSPAKDHRVSHIESAPQPWMGQTVVVPPAQHLKKASSFAVSTHSTGSSYELISCWLPHEILPPVLLLETAEANPSSRATSVHTGSCGASTSLQTGPHGHRSFKSSRNAEVLPDVHRSKSCMPCSSAAPPLHSREHSVCRRTNPTLNPEGPDSGTERPSSKQWRKSSSHEPRHGSVSQAKVPNPYSPPVHHHGRKSLSSTCSICSSHSRGRASREKGSERKKNAVVEHHHCSSFQKKEHQIASASLSSKREAPTKAEPASNAPQLAHAAVAKESSRGDHLSTPSASPRTDTPQSSVKVADSPSWHSLYLYPAVSGYGEGFQGASTASDASPAAAVASNGGKDAVGGGIQSPTECQVNLPCFYNTYGFQSFLHSAMDPPVLRDNHEEVTDTKASLPKEASHHPFRGKPSLQTSFYDVLSTRHELGKEESPDHPCVRNERGSAATPCASQQPAQSALFPRQLSLTAMQQALSLSVLPAGPTPGGWGSGGECDSRKGRTATVGGIVEGVPGVGQPSHDPPAREATSTTSELKAVDEGAAGCHAAANEVLSEEEDDGIQERRCAYRFSFISVGAPPTSQRAHPPAATPAQLPSTDDRMSGGMDGGDDEADDDERRRRRLLQRFFSSIELLSVSGRDDDDDEVDGDSNSDDSSEGSGGDERRESDGSCLVAVPPSEARYGSSGRDRQGGESASHSDGSPRPVLLQAPHLRSLRHRLHHPLGGRKGGVYAGTYSVPLRGGADDFALRRAAAYVANNPLGTVWMWPASPVRRTTTSKKVSELLGLNETTDVTWVKSPNWSLLS